MERIGNIMKTASGQYEASHQRVPPQHLPDQRYPSQGQRSLVEQSKHQDGGARLPAGYRMQYQGRLRGSDMPNESWEKTTRPPVRARHTNYQNQSHPRTTRISRYTEQPPRGDYFEENEHATATPAELREDWNDDTAGMLYGDWESVNDYQHGTPYQEESEYELPTESHPREASSISPDISEAAQRLAQHYNAHNTLATRQLYNVTPENQHPAQGREIREALLSGRGSSSQLTARRLQQRTTQPLRPQHAARTHAEMQQQALRSSQAGLPETPRDTFMTPAHTAPGTQSTCPYCKGAGFLRNNVPFGHPQFGKAVACQCKEHERKRKRRQQLQEISNLGAFANKRFSTFNPRVPGMQEAFHIAVEFAKAPDGWLLLVGPNGCGKTHLAAAIANECLEAGAVVLFSTVPDLLDHLRAAFAPDSPEVYDQLFARMREAEVLVLDDLGVQQSSPWANEKLFQLLNYRYNSGFPTVITANSRGLQATDERIRSRLSDVGLVAMLNLERARDYRPNNPHRA